MDKKKIIIAAGIVILSILLLVFIFLYFSRKAENKYFPAGIENLSKQKIAIIYHPYGESIKQVANIIHDKVGGDVFILDPNVAYPTKDKGILKIKEEQKNPDKVVLKKFDYDIKPYKIIFVGLPVIENNMSPIMMRFLLDNENIFGAEQIIIPFTTYTNKDSTAQSDNFLYYHVGKAIRKNGYITSHADYKANELYIHIWLNDIRFTRKELE